MYAGYETMYVHTCDKLQSEHESIEVLPRIPKNYLKRKIDISSIILGLVN